MDEIRKRIETIAWAGTATGDTAGASKALLDLLAPDAAQRTRAMRKLACQVALQFDLYEAAYGVASVLVDMVKAKVPGRAEAYHLLFDIASGFAPAEQMCDTPEGKRPLREACGKAVLSGQEHYLRDLGDASIPVKLAALNVLELFPEARQATAKRLREVVGSEKDPDTKIRFLTAADSLSG